MSEPARTELPQATVRRILVVDDSMSVQEAVRSAFASEPDIQVEVAGDLDAAEAHLARRLPDVILCDVVLPGRPGYELCAALKGRPATRRLPILLLSGAFEPFDSERARQAGADAVLGKPFTASELRRRVRQALAGEMPPGVTDVEESDLVREPPGEAGEPEGRSPTAELARLLVEPLASRLAGPLADELERRLAAGPGPLSASVREAVAAAAERLVRRRLAELEGSAAGDGTSRTD